MSPPSATASAPTCRPTPNLLIPHQLKERGTIKTRNSFALLAAATLTASTALLATPASAHALSTPTTTSTATASATDDGPLATANVITDNGEAHVKFDLSNATATLNDDGSVTVSDRSGEALEVMKTSLTSQGGSQAPDVRYEVDNGGEVIRMYDISPSLDLGQPSVGPSMGAMSVDQDCARSNVLWGAGGGATLGLVAGPAGAAVGALTGLGLAGLQSIADC